MTTQVIDRKLARLNTAYAVVREWQRGAISFAEMKDRMGIDLTQSEIDTVTAGLCRTISQESLAGLIAGAIGL